MSGTPAAALDPVDVVGGDETGILMPAHEGAFRAGGAAFLTQAFRVFGAIAADNAVARITRLDPCPGGSTGSKLFLSVEYARDEPGLQRELFVKFSRDFTDTRRDQARYEMAAEVRFAAVSRAPGFPIRVPTAYFGDFHQESGTGLLVTERVAFGEDGIEPQHAKCRDHEIADPLAYYRALVTALARLAAAHKAGHLASDVDRRFPFDRNHAGVEPIVRDEAALRRVVAGARQFALDLPQLLPGPMRAPELYDRILTDALRIRAHRARVTDHLLGDRDLVALCHWNAHIDNAWFWRDGQGALHCGLMDWGQVSQITLGAALWGCLSGADLAIVRDDLEGLIALFARVYAENGGPAIDPARLERHFLVHVATMGVARVLALCKAVRLRVPDAAQASGPLDPMILGDETARTVLHVYTVLLTLWSKPAFGAALDEVLPPA